MKQETKTSLATIAILLGAIATIYLIAFSNQIFNPSQLRGVVGVVGIVVGVGVIVGVVVGVEVVIGVVGIVGVVVGVGVVGIVGVVVGVRVVGVIVGVGVIVVGVIVGVVGVIIGIISYNKETDTLDIRKFSTLVVIFLLPILTLVTPISKYHNTNQLQRDAVIMEVLETNSKEITLPTEYAKHNSYMNKVLSITIEGKTKTWKELAIPHTIGNKKWHVVPLPENTSKVTFFFDHCWEDKKETILIK